MATKFKIGDLVWAKMKGFPAWPGKVIQPKPEVKKPSDKKPKHFVFFFGSENYAWVYDDSMFDYVSSKSKFMMTSRIPRGFKEATEAIEDLIKTMPQKEPPAKTKDLPTIDDELAVIFTPGSSKKSSAHPKIAKAKGKITNQRGKSKSSGAGSIAKKERDDKMRPPSPGANKKKESKASQKLTPRMPLKKRAHSPATSSTPPPKKGRILGKKVNDQPSIFTNSINEKVYSFSVENDEDMEPSPSTVKASASSSSSISTATSPSKYKTDIQPLLDSFVPDIASMLAEPIAPKKDIIPTPLKIGFLGLGIMGTGMVTNMLRSGHEVTVWNRTPSKCREFVKEGGLKGNSPSEVVQTCDITFSCVSDPTALKDLVFGNCGVLQGISQGKSYVDMSTVDVETITDVHEAVTARGGRFLEAPVIGSRQPSLDGQLVVLAAGDRSLFDDCYSCFEAVGKKTYYLGEIGCAAKMKLVTNLFIGTMLAGLAETLALAEKVGLDQEEVLQILSHTPVSCPFIKSKGTAMINSDYRNVNSYLKTTQKDLRLLVNMADSVDQPLHVGSSVNELFKKAKAKGYGEHDTAAVYRAADL